MDNLEEVLEKITRLFLDTAPVIYYIENHPIYYPAAKFVFDKIDEGPLEAITSPITLSECLVTPIRRDQENLQHNFQHVIIHARHTTLIPIDDETGLLAAKLRAQYHFALPDAMQLAVAIQTGCDSFLTNDTRLKQIQGLDVILMNDFV